MKDAAGHKCPANSVGRISVSVWCGFVATGTPYESYSGAATATDASPHGNTILTLGANRTVINWYSNDQANASEAPGGGNLNGWTDAYKDLGGIRCAATCSYKVVASASSVTREARTFAATERWRCFTLALIKA